MASDSEWRQTACVSCASNCERPVGVALIELTALEDKDPFVGTPWHKFVPAHIEPLHRTNGAHHL